MPRARFDSAAPHLTAEILSRVDVNQSCGIEREEFPARIAQTAMWMMDHLLNRELSDAFGQVFLRIPPKASPTIVHGDAPETDWATVRPPERCSFVPGNPPFVGAKFRTGAQRAQVRRIAGLGKSGGTLDCVAAWFREAGEYLRRGDGDGAGAPPRIAFVATNSITQGAQVARLRPPLLDRHRVEIAFAHRTFARGSDARGKAHVPVVILGLDRAEPARAGRRLCSYPDPDGDPVESTHKAISPYLFDAGGLANPHALVREEARPINGLKRILIGSKPIDGGHCIFDEAEGRAFLAAEPGAARFFRPYVGCREFLHGERRFILCVGDAEPADLAPLRKVGELIEAVRAFRLGRIPPKGKGEEVRRDPGLSTAALAETPQAFPVTVVPDRPLLVLPEVSSERHDDIPVGRLEPPAIPDNLVRVLPDATLPEFALLTSAMHMARARHIGGRLEGRYRSSIGLVYNTFPLPPPGHRPLATRPLAQAILDARAAHPGATLVTLHDPDLIPADLRRAHQALDRAVDRLYRRPGFASDRERVEHLLALCEGLAAGLFAETRKPRRRRPAPDSRPQG